MLVKVTSKLSINQELRLKFIIRVLVEKREREKHYLSEVNCFNDTHFSSLLYVKEPVQFYMILFDNPHCESIDYCRDSNYRNAANFYAAGPFSTSQQRGHLFSTQSDRKNARYISCIFSQLKKNTFLTLSASFAGANQPAPSGFSKVLISFSTMHIGRLYDLPKKFKTNIALKILSVKLLRRYILLLNVFSIMIVVKSLIPSLKVLINHLTSPLMEIFKHPITKGIVSDLILSLNTNLLISKQIKDFFNQQISNLSRIDATDNVTTESYINFCRDFLRKCKEIKYDKKTRERIYWNFNLNCEFVSAPASIKPNYYKAKPLRSIKRRITKRITKEVQYRLWVF